MIPGRSWHKFVGCGCRVFSCYVGLTFENRHKDDRIHRAYTQAYRRMDSRKRTRYISRAEFAEWGKTAREKRTLCENGEISLEEFQAWLDKTKLK